MISFSKKNILIAFFIAVFLFFCWGIYVPKSLAQKPVIVYTVEKGWGAKDISRDLAKRGIIKHFRFFDIYGLVFGGYKKLQAGTYELSPSMSVAQVMKKIATGDVVKNTITIIEGWDLQDISNLFEGAKIDKKLEGYLFPDTYQISKDGGLDELIQKAQANFEKKLTPELRAEIAKQKKTIPQIITMASLIEKEVISVKDKKMVSGILWKRLAIDMPLQVDATINYITQKPNGQITAKDKAIDSPYNTYKYYGLPAGPICNPGLESIIAAIYPEKSAYWYYLSAKDTGETIFSKTLEEHNAAVQKYLR